MNEEMQQEPVEPESDSRYAAIVVIFGGLIALVLVAVLAITIFTAWGQAGEKSATTETAPAAAEAAQPESAEAPAEEAAPAAEEAAATEGATTEEAAAEAPAEEAPASEEAAPAESAPPEAPPEVAQAFVKGTCIGCHTIPGVPGANGMVGPDLSNIGVEGATYIEGMSAEEYIRQSIVDPEAFITPECPTGPCPSGVMSPAFAQMLSPEELDGIVAYLATLKTE